MAVTNGYIGLEVLRQHLGISDTRDDDSLERIIEGVSRAIDDETKRRFYAVTETRYYTPEASDHLLVDDLLSVTTLQTDQDCDGAFEKTWTANVDYFLEPANAALESTPRPYEQIVTTGFGSYAFPRGMRRSVKILGSFGFSATVPKVVARAALFQCALEFAAEGAPLGTSGGGAEFDQRVRTIGLHPFVKRMLIPVSITVVG